jgi:hypothetical protein
MTSEHAAAGGRLLDVESQKHVGAVACQALTPR